MSARPSIELASAQQIEPLWVGEQHIVVMLAGTAYAIPLLAVQEVENPPPIVPVPFAPEWIAGVVNLRGSVLTFVDLPMLLGLGTWRRGVEAKMLVLRGYERVAVAVDGLRGMRRLPEQERSHIEGALPGQVARYISAMYRNDDELLGILDLQRLLDDADAGMNERSRTAPTSATRPTGMTTLLASAPSNGYSEKGDARALTF